MPIEQLAGVICAGGICLDILLRPIDQLQWGTSTWAEEFIEELGGNGGNTAFAAALLGTPVRLMGMVGDDPAGERVLARLRGAGVDLSLVECAAAQTTTTICIVNSAGDRFFLKNLGVSKQIFATPIEFTAPVAAGHTHFHLANLFSLPHLSRHGGEILRRAREAGLSTSLDTGWDPENRWLERVGPCLPHTDLLFINQDEARMLTGSTDPQTAARFLREQGVRDVAMKLGAEGCVVVTPETSFHSPGFQVETVDTTGAGDCFAGAFLAALHRGESYERAACFANAVGAMAVRQLGAISGMRPYAETMAWFEQAKRQAAG
jgi:sugar/nucleoside kinase (ribokinase family)